MFTYTETNTDIHKSIAAAIFLLLIYFYNSASRLYAILCNLAS